MVHQHSALVPAFTVAENLCFGDTRGGPWFRPDAELRAAEAQSRRFELEVPAGRRVDELSPGQRQRAEILRALGRGARLLILDEPTAVLTPGEAESLFAAVRRLRDAGRAVIFISHKLAGSSRSRIASPSLRRGAWSRTSAREQSARELGRLMLGRDLPPLERRPCQPASPAAAARPLRCPASPSGAGCAASISLRGADRRRGQDRTQRRQRELEGWPALRKPSAGRSRWRGAAWRSPARAAGQARAPLG
jgi:simple sugar transport system ATP-binding protein